MSETLETLRNNEAYAKAAADRALLLVDLLEQRWADGRIENYADVQIQTDKFNALANTHHDATAEIERYLDRQTDTCVECGRVFDMFNADDVDEWHNGHDCETPTTTPTTTVDLPTRFYDDHAWRDCDDGCTIVKRLARTTRVEMTDAAFAEMRSDAVHYSTDYASDPEWQGLSKSAAATVRALDRSAR